MVDRALSCVSAPVRLVGMFVCVLCVCLTQSPLYLMLMAAIALVLVAVRPVRGCVRPLYRRSAPRGLRWFWHCLPCCWALLPRAHAQDRAQDVINVSFVLGVRGRSPGAACRRRSRRYSCPTRSSLRLIWRSSISKCWDARRTICANRSCCAVWVVRCGFSRTDSLAGIMGMTFIKAMECSHAMDEAMLCRGFAGAYPAPARAGFGWRDAVYAAGVALLAVLCAVL